MLTNKAQFSSLPSLQVLVAVPSTTKFSSPLQDVLQLQKLNSEDAMKAAGNAIEEFAFGSQNRPKMFVPLGNDETHTTVVSSHNSANTVYNDHSKHYTAGGNINAGN